MKIGMTIDRLKGAARTLGGNAADAYFDETGETPTRETAGDWDAAAWEHARKELADLGMTDEDLWPDFLSGFYGD